MAEKLRHAGYKSDSALQYLYAVKGILGIALALIWLACSRFLPSLTTGRIFFFALAAAFVGMVLPNHWLDRRVEARRKSLRNGFPDALDMLTVCVESGLGLAAAIQRVADELEISHPELAVELGQVNAQMRAGVERETALRGLADRTGLDDIRGLVGLCFKHCVSAQASRMRCVSTQGFREKRNAEESAAKIGTKLISRWYSQPCFFVVTSARQSYAWWRPSVRTSKLSALPRSHGANRLLDTARRSQARHRRQSGSSVGSTTAKPVAPPIATFAEGVKRGDAAWMAGGST